MVVAILALVSSCGDDSGSESGTETAANGITTRAGGEATTSATTGEPTAENTEPGQIRSWSVRFSGAIGETLQASTSTDLSLSTVPDCSSFEIIVFDDPARTSRVAVVDFDVAEPITAPGPLTLTNLSIGEVGPDGFSVATTYSGSGTIDVGRYDGGAPEERRMAFAVSGTATDDADGTVDVALSVDWNDSCDR